MDNDSHSMQLFAFLARNVSTKTDIDASTRSRQREPISGTLHKTCMDGVSYLGTLPPEPRPMWTRPTDERTRSQMMEKKKQIQASNRKSRQTKKRQNPVDKVVLDKRAIHGLFVRVYGCTPMASQRTYGYLPHHTHGYVRRQSGLRNGMLGGGMACVRNYGSRPPLAASSTHPFHEKLSYLGTRRCAPLPGRR